MEHIKATVGQVLRVLSVRKRTQRPLSAEGDIEGLIKKSLTKRELEHIKFNYFRKGILSINVDSSVWRYSLSLRKDKLLMKLKNKLSAIKDIRFRIGEVK